MADLIFSRDQYVKDQVGMSVALDHAEVMDVVGFIYFFEFACGVSGYLLGVNPFDQPGVEAYKKNMFALLGKPGYEDRKKELEARLK